MSGGRACNAKHRRSWVVIQRRCNHSTFNGGRRTPSNYSAVYCKECNAVWRTNARYVSELPDGRIGD